jgi:putative hemolysin
VSPTLYDPTGGEYALCIFSNDTACDEWAYFRGECNTTNPNFALYCADNGGEVSQENVDWGDVEGALPATYEVCTTDGVECTEYNYYDSRCKQVVTTTIAPSSLGGVGIPNPASTGCAENGGSSESMYQADGGQYGVCIFPDGTACEEWALERGECAKGTKPVFSTYCADTGGEMSEENVDWGSTEGAPPATYEVCTINGAQCAAEYYYTSGCANFNATSPTLVAGADPTSTPSGSNGLSHGIVASLLVISIHIFAFGIGILV